MIKRISICALIGCILSGCGFNDKATLFSKIEGSSLNVFHIARTGFSYEGKPLYTIETPIPYAESAFVMRNYLMVDKETVYEVTLYENCKNEYEKDNYRFFYSPMNRGHNKYKDCDITLYPVVDFSLAVNDTLKVGGGMWVTLHKKIFETSLKDSVYIYHRRFGSDKVTTVIVANRDFGIIGKYEIDAHGLISDCIGKIYLNESVSCNSTVPLSKPKIDLQDVKIFHR